MAGTNRAAIRGAGGASDPLTPMQITFDELRVSVPKPGRYDLALLTGDDEIARQPLLVGRADVLGGDLA